MTVALLELFQVYDKHWK